MSESYIIVGYRENGKSDLFRFLTFYEFINSLKEIKDSNIYKSIGTYKRFTIKLDK